MCSSLIYEKQRQCQCILLNRSYTLLTLTKGHLCFDGIWIIATQAELYFSIVCKNYTKVLLSKPPISVLSLEMGCSASNDYMTLMPYCHKESTYVISDIFSELLQLNNKSQTNLWNVFTSRLPNFMKIDIPEHLKALEKILLDTTL